MHEKAFLFCIVYATAKSEIKFCSKKHETGIVLPFFWEYIMPIESPEMFITVYWV